MGREVLKKFVIIKQNTKEQSNLETNFTRTNLFDKRYFGIDIIHEKIFLLD